MIYITQGHEKGIGIEVFLKSILCFDQDFQKEIIFVGYSNSLKNTLSTLQLDYQIAEDHFMLGSQRVNSIFLSQTKESETVDSLVQAINHYNHGDIIVTLPSSKDQFTLGNKNFKGHTDFLSHYLNEEPGMCFLGPNSNVLLLTDHIELGRVYKVIKEKNLTEFIRGVIASFPESRPISEIVVAGINPHFGEDGNISDQDLILKDLDQEIFKNFKIQFLSGDTAHFEGFSKEKLFIYPSHDQGLGVFKSTYGLTGINYSANMKIKRVSVDHGTAFGLYGQNQADYQGMNFLLNEVKNW